MISRSWQGPTLRDVLVSSLRRAPSSHTNNSDSLRRVVLQRNLVATASNDAELGSPKLVNRPWHSYDVPITITVDGHSSVKRTRSDHLEPTKTALGSPSPSQVIQTDRTEHTEHLQHEIAAQREQAWFDQIMDDLEWENSLGVDLDESQSVPNLESSDPPHRPLRRKQRQHMYSRQLSLLPTIPE
ncbi:hypothetical protein MYAM1_003831 [Malassezia yamatoensis]|uniref:Uncharacterized protein n=1 Tax=Malassezia yamatoensis TaxID=253288 RepID=A0AAJ6CIK7_9BASI|nr:hypothetical protein MYAM1_003831 [Malassezia yamatoensis]